jgi:dipeptidyl aminopeptidase/acylaminoacyl peptidase
MPKPIDTRPDAIWKQRFRAPSIMYATIAPLTPDRGLVWTNQSGMLQFHTWDVPSGQLRQLTHDPNGQSSPLTLSPDGRWAYYLQDDHGNEIGHYVRIPYEGGEPQDITPDMPPYSSFYLGFSRDGTRLGFTTAGPEGFTIFLADLHPDGSLSTPKQIHMMKSIGYGPMLSADGKVAIVMSSEHTGKNEFALIAFDADTGERISAIWDGDGTSINYERFARQPGDPRMLANTNRSGIERLLLWNPLTGERTDLDLDIPGAQGISDWSEDGKRIYIQALDKAVQTHYLLDLSSQKLRRLNFPGGDYRPFLTPGSQKLFAMWNDAGHNTRVVELDETTGTIVRTVLAAGDTPEGHPLRSVTFHSSDGQEIQGWLCLPDGEGPFPTVLETHGGPTAVETNGFNPGAQAWVDHGFAFLTINYRGSVTFGREFEQKIWHDMGHWEVEDMKAAYHWLVDQGIAKPKEVFLTGWSYGGYLTLLGLGKTPELWAGGMAGIAIADWAVQWEDTADTLRGYQEALFGGTPSQVPDRYRDSSPITYAANVCAPLLIIQGKSDTRTPARPVEMYEQKMKELGKEIVVHWYDTGHAGSFANTELGITHHEMMMQFASGRKPAS